jgi:hypothetical protein
VRGSRQEARRTGKPREAVGMAWSRRRFAIWACVLGALMLTIGIGVATGAKLKTKSASTTLSSGEFDSVTAKCKRGTKAVAGGFDSEIDLGGGPTEAIIPYMSRAEGGREWSSAGYNVSEPGELTSFAYCRDQKIKRRSSETTLSAGETDTVTARCPRGTKVASGGFDNPDFSISGPSATAIFPFASLKTGKREWTVSARNLGDASGDLVAQVNCHERKGLKTADEDLSITSSGVHDVVAECAAGRRVVSGGFDYSLEPSLGAFVFASHKVGKREWEVEALDLVEPATLTAYAYCEKKKK